MPISLPGSSQPEFAQPAANYSMCLGSCKLTWRSPTGQPIIVVFFGSRLPKIPIPAANGFSGGLLRVGMGRAARETIQAPAQSLQFCILHGLSPPPVVREANSRIMLVHVGDAFPLPDLSEFLHVLQVHEHAKMAEVLGCHHVPECSPQCCASKYNSAFLSHGM